MVMAHEFGMIEPEKTTAPGLKLFGDVAQEYLDISDLAFTTSNNYKNALNKYWMPHLATIPIRGITYPMLNRILKNTPKIGWKTRKNILVPLKQVFKFALYEAEYIEANPAERLKVKRGQKPEIDPFTLDESEAILGALTGQALFFFTMALDTGMRTPSEILALTWDDFDGKSLSVTKARVTRQLKNSTKTYQARKVLVSKRLRKLLMEYKMKARSQHIFELPNGNPVRDSEEFNLQWKAALEKAGIRYRRPYNCRHTFASQGLTAGLKPGFLASQLGHSLEMFYNTYARWINTDEDIAELERFEEFRNKK